MTLQELYGEFVKVTKCVLKEKISENPEKLKEYRVKLIEANNKLVEYVNVNYYLRNRTDQATYDQCLEETRVKLVRCFEKLKCECELGNLTDLIDFETIREPQLQFEKDLGSATGGADELEEFLSEESKQGEQKVNTTSTKMAGNALSSVDFWRLAATHLNKNYSGDPLGLRSFIDSMMHLSRWRKQPN